MQNWVLDAVLVPVGMALLVAYNVTFFLRVKYQPLRTVVGVNHINRRAWVRSVMKDIDKKNILAIQTLRNSIMASTLLASTAMLLCAAIAAFVASSTTNVTVSNSINSVVIGSQEPALATFKFFSILLCFIFSFMCHVQSIRYTNHVGYLIAIPLSPEIPGLTADYVGNVLARGSNFFTVGTRGFYCAFPMLLWLFGPIPMLAACIILVPSLYHLDTAAGFEVDLRHPNGPLGTSAAAPCAGGQSDVQAQPIDPEKGLVKDPESSSSCLISSSASNLGQRSCDNGYQMGHAELD